MAESYPPMAINQFFDVSMQDTEKSGWVKSGSLVHWSVSILYFSHVARAAKLTFYPPKVKTVFIYLSIQQPYDILGSSIFFFGTRLALYCVGLLTSNTSSDICLVFAFKPPRRKRRWGTGLSPRYSNVYTTLGAKSLATSVMTTGTKSFRIYRLTILCLF